MMPARAASSWVRARWPWAHCSPSLPCRRWRPPRRANGEPPPEEQPEQYPEGPNRNDTFYFCTACHSFKIVAQQGMSRQRWNETLDFMVLRHKMVDVQAAERDKILDYLTTALPERTGPGGWRNPFAVK